jgi:hypothetical protein
MSKPSDNDSTNAEAQIEKIREVLEAAIVLRDEAAEARDRTQDLNQASYWSGRANALSEVIKRLQSAGV